MRATRSISGNHDGGTDHVGWTLFAFWGIGASDFSRDDDNIEPRFTTAHAGDVDHLSNQPPNIIFKAGNPYVDAFAHARLDRERYLNALRMVSEFSNEYCRYNGQYPLLLSAKHSTQLFTSPQKATISISFTANFARCAG